MKTICYVDGYNLYYGCLKNSSHKWLDLKVLLTDIIHQQNPSSSIEKIKFFTAPVITKIATHGSRAQNSQQTYHRALQYLYPECIEIINGYYTSEKVNAMRFINPPDKTERVDVWNLEEKQTDVNIALTAYRDAIHGYAEQVVFVSNDTDLEPALRAIREDLEDKIVIGVILPLKERLFNETARPGNKRLSIIADWTRKHIKNEELKKSHLPDRIPTTRKTIHKPDYW